MRIAIVTNIPAPYRLPVYALLADMPEVELCVFFFCGREPDRQWDLPDGNFKRIFLHERFVNFRGRFIHANPDIWSELRTFCPDVVVTTGFNPTHLLAYVYTLLHRAHHVAMTDGTLQSEQKLYVLHRLVRKVVYAGTRAFIGASDGAFALYRSYGINPAHLFKSHLCANNAAFFSAPSIEKKYDFIFCSRFVDIKNPLFAIKVASGVARALGRRTSILFVGAGEMEHAMRAAVATAAGHVDGIFAGFARQEDLPSHYGAARIFLFPTLWDPWGVVANEACAAGVPVIATSVAGSSGELVRDGDNGFILPLDVDKWIDASVRLLNNETLYSTMSARCRSRVAEYNFANAALGILQATQATQITTDEQIDDPTKLAAPATQRAKVVIIQRRMTHYRIPLFELMRDKLKRASIDLEVVFGDPSTAEKSKADGGVLSWGKYVPCRYLFNNRLCWQNPSTEVRGADLVVMTQENKMLFNHVFRFLHRGQKMALWGHGRNFQSTRQGSLSERIKRWLLTRTDWWFAYTDMSAKIVAAADFPVQRVTVLNNSIDTHALSSDLALTTEKMVTQARARYGVGAGPIGIMIASLHRDKKIGFLIEAARTLRRAIPDFELILVGDGPERNKVRRAMLEEPDWIHWVGARTGSEKALLLKMSTVTLNPGMVGLGILDAFVAKVPMVTTHSQYHSPEIAYLENGINGLITDDNVVAYADAVLALLHNHTLYRQLQQGCERAASKITLDKMADHFCEGITRCLGRPSATPLAGQIA